MASINKLNPRKRDEESYKAALKYMDTVFPAFPDYSNFKLSSIIAENFRNEEFYQELYECHSHLEDLLKRDRYIETGTAGNLTIRLTESGRNKKKQIIEQIEIERASKNQTSELSFEEQANAVIEVLLKQQLPYLYAIIYHELKDRYPHLRLHEILEELKRLDLIVVGKDRQGHDTYLLTQSAKRKIANVPIEFKANVYDYLLFLNEEKDSGVNANNIVKQEFSNYQNSQSTRDAGSFTAEDIRQMNKKLDDAISELKAGQEIIWTDLLKEINELKQLYFLSKKNWRQMLAGKFSEMVIGGVVSETVSKQIIESVNPVLSNLLSS